MSSVKSSGQFVKKLEEDMLASTPSKGTSEASSLSPVKKDVAQAQSSRKQSQRKTHAKKNSAPQVSDAIDPPKRRGGR